MKENEINILHYLNNTVEEKNIVIVFGERKRKDFSRLGVAK